MPKFYLFEVVADAIAQIEYEEVSENIKQLRKESIMKLLPVFLEFHRQGFRTELMKRAFEKKVEFLLQASSSAEAKEILKLSVPYYNYSEIVPKNTYHIEEEELMLWMGICSFCKLREEAVKRIMYLFEKIFPEEFEQLYGAGA